MDIGSSDGYWIICEHNNWNQTKIYASYNFNKLARVRCKLILISQYVAMSILFTSNLKMHFNSYFFINFQSLMNAT